MTLGAALAALVGSGVGLGLVLTLTGLMTTDRVPARPRVADSGVSRRARDAGWWRRVGVALGLGLVAGWSTGWPVAMPLVAAGVWWLPRVLGRDREHEAAVARIEAVAGWAEQLRDTLAAAAGLEQAISATARTAPAVVRPAVAALAARIHAGERLPAALAHAARELADPTADLVIAALTMAARAQARQLAELLAVLAATAREEAAGRMRTAVARARVRTSVRVIVGATVGLAAVLTVLNSAYLEPFGAVEGQVVLAAVGGLFGVAFAWLARIARPPTVPRLLVDAGRMG